MADLPTPRWPTPRWPTGVTTARAAAPAKAGKSRQDKEPGGSDQVSRFAAVALLLVAMLIWLFTALLFAHHGYYYVHHQYPGPAWQQGTWQQQP